MQSMAILHWDFMGLESCVYDLPTEHSARTHCSDMWAYSLFSNIFERQSNEKTLRNGGQGIGFPNQTLPVPFSPGRGPPVRVQSISGRWLGFSLASPWLHSVFYFPLLKGGSF